jgi:hypothetical protein
MLGFGRKAIFEELSRRHVDMEEDDSGTIGDRRGGGLQHEPSILVG